MANTDSFIDEVSEEVRRDRLYALMRRWGWVPILVVLAIVGAAAYNEWSKAQQQASARAFGDATITALNADETEARLAGLAEVEAPTPEAGIILALLAAGETADGEDRVSAAATLREAAEAADLAPRYAHLALLKAEMLDPAPEEEARAVLETLAAPGAPYSGLAEEQLALMEIRTGNLDAGLDRLRAIERSAAATAGLQQRAAQLIIALESGSILLDTAPVVEEPVEESAAEEETPAAPAEDPATEEEARPAADATEPAEEVTEQDPAAASAADQDPGASAADEDPAAASAADQDPAAASAADQDPEASAADEDAPAGAADEEQDP